MSRIKRAVKGFIDPITTKVEDWKWRALADVDKELKLKEVPDYIQSGYGGFMADQLKRAEAGDLNARDLIKAYTITQSSIGRKGLQHSTATKRGLRLPDTGGEVRPEGAFAEWLGSPLGQRYLDMAERGELDSKALKEIQAAFAPFGKQNDQVAKMEWAAQNLPGMATDLNTRVTGALGDWRDYTDRLQGIAAAKSGFVGSLLGRGDVPTLDARQLNLHGTTPPVGLGSIQQRGGGTGGRELVDRLTARQEALGLKLDPSLDPFYQHLGHHAVWDKIGNTQTTHEDVVRAMRDYNKGGAVHMAGGSLVKKAGKAATNRIDMHFKDVTKRTPELQEAANRLISGELSAAEYDALVNQHKPVTPYATVPTPATREEATGALTSDKRELYGVPSQTLEQGHPVGLRLDIPSYSNHGVWVPTVHEQEAGFGAGKSIGHESVASVLNPQFGMSEKAALAIAGGKPKGTIATIKGDWNKLSEQEAVERAREYLKNPEWRQVGMDPERHSYFYDRATMQPVTSADEAIQVGPLVLVKNPVYGKKEDFKFAAGGMVDSVPEEAIKNMVKDPQAARLLDLDLAKYALMNQPQRMAAGGIAHMAAGGARKAVKKVVTGAPSHVPDFKIKDLGGLAPVQPVNLETKLGAMLNVNPWDVMHRNQQIMEVSGLKVPDEVISHGGQAYVRDLEHMKQRIGGASNEDIAKRVQKRFDIASREGAARGGTGEVVASPFTMGDTSVNFAMPVTELYRSYFNANATPKDFQDLSDSLRATNVKGKKPFADAPNFDDPAVDQYIKENPEFRKAFLLKMQTGQRWQELTGINPLDALAAFRDPNLLGVSPYYAGHTLIDVQPGAGLRPSRNRTYSHEWDGLYGGSIPNTPVPILLNDAFTPIAQEIRTRSLAPTWKLGPVTNNQIADMTTKALGSRNENISELVTDEMIRRVEDYHKGLKSGAFPADDLTSAMEYLKLPKFKDGGEVDMKDGGKADEDLFALKPQPTPAVPTVRELVAEIGKSPARYEAKYPAKDFTPLELQAYRLMQAAKATPDAGRYLESLNPYFDSQLRFDIGGGSDAGYVKLKEPNIAVMQKLEDVKNTIPHELTHTLQLGKGKGTELERDRQVMQRAKALPIETQKTMMPSDNRFENMKETWANINARAHEVNAAGGDFINSPEGRALFPTPEMQREYYTKSMPGVNSMTPSTGTFVPNRRYADGGGVFNPQGADYDYQTARAYGMGQDGGNWGSVAPASEGERKLHGLPEDSYLMLKGSQHPTWGKAVEAETARGSKIVKHGDRYYSVPNKANGGQVQQFKDGGKGEKTGFEEILDLKPNHPSDVKSTSDKPQPKVPAFSVRDIVARIGSDRAKYEELAADPLTPFKNLLPIDAAAVRLLEAANKSGNPERYLETMSPYHDSQLRFNTYDSDSPYPKLGGWVHPDEKAVANVNLHPSSNIIVPHELAHTRQFLSGQVNQQPLGENSIYQSAREFPEDVRKQVLWGSNAGDNPMELWANIEAYAHNYNAAGGDFINSPEGRALFPTPELQREYYTRTIPETSSATPSTGTFVANTPAPEPVDRSKQSYAQQALRALGFAEGGQVQRFDDGGEVSQDQMRYELDRANSPVMQATPRSPVQDFIGTMGGYMDKAGKFVSEAIAPTAEKHPVKHFIADLLLAESLKSAGTALQDYTGTARETDEDNPVRGVISKDWRKLSTSTEPLLDPRALDIAGFATPVVRGAKKLAQVGAKAITPFAKSTAEMAAELYGRGQMPGMVAPNAYMAEPSAPKPAKVLAPANEQGFYSPVEAAALNLQRQSGSGQALLNDIMKGENVRAEEVTRMGLDTFLKDKPNATAAEVQDYIAQNKLQLGDRTYKKEDVKWGENESGETVTENLPNPYTISSQYGKTYITNSKNDTLGITFKNEQEAKKYIEEMAREDALLPNDLKWAQWSLPGGENHREVTLNLPSGKREDMLHKEQSLDALKRGALDYAAMGDLDIAKQLTARANKLEREIEQLKRQPQNRTPDFPKQAELDDLDARMAQLKAEGNREEFGKLQSERGVLRREREDYLRQEQVRIAKEVRANQFRESHWEDPNVLAHLRMSDRVTDGKKTLLVDELQSDWHQKGRKRGYRGDEIDTKGWTVESLYVTKPEEVAVYDARGKEIWAGKSKGDEAQTIAKVVEELKKKQLPQAPYKDDYYQLALRRAIKDAIDGGYDRVALTTGSRVAERFGTGSRIDRLDYNKNSDGTYGMSAIKNGREVAAREYLSEDEFFGLIGKDLAKKIVDEEGSISKEVRGRPDDDYYENFKSLTGLDLVIGGKGMKKYYDEIYPGYLKKFGKKYGANVGSTTVDADGVAEPLFYMDITPAMRKEFSTGIHMKRGGKVSFASNIDAMRHELTQRQ